MDPDSYVHGRTEREFGRLRYQAEKLAEVLQKDTRYQDGDLVLEAACGVGAQTVILSRNSPGARFVSVDISPESLSAAESYASREGLRNVSFQQADVLDLPFEPETFDHVFVCFLLEHLNDPLLALERFREVLKPGGSITVIEGDHGSAFFYPESPYAVRVIDCLIEIQREMGGNALIGRELFHLMRDAGFDSISVSPRSVYSDGERPEAWEQVRNIFIAMVEGVRDQAIERRMVDQDSWERGILDLDRIAGPSGSFCYTFFKATAVKRSNERRTGTGHQ